MPSFLRWAGLFSAQRLAMLTSPPNLIFRSQLGS